MLGIFKHIFLLMLMVFYHGVFSQNLVPNPGFETISTCVYYMGDSNCPPWSSPSRGSPDYFNLCNVVSQCGVPQNIHGYQDAKSGSGYVGIAVYDKYSIPNFREYITTELLDILIAGRKYCLSFYVNLSDKSRYAVNCMEMAFTKNQVYFPILYSEINLNPQFSYNSVHSIKDSMNWVLMNGEFVAGGGEKYVTIGCFKADSEITAIDSLPFISMAYKDAYYYIDDIFVGLCSDTAFIEVVIPNIMTINGDELNDTFVIQNLPEKSSLFIYNRWGTLIYESGNYLNNWDGELDIGNKKELVSPGMYYYVLRLFDGSQKKGFFQVIR